MIFLSFLIPPALYFLTLAFRNRSRHPFLVGGHWDFAGVIFALSGFLLFGGPAILDALYQRWRIDWILGRTRILNGIADHWLFWVSLWIVYFTLVLGSMILLIRRRRKHTSIYNIEPEEISPLLLDVMKRLGLVCSLEAPGRILLGEPDSMATVEIESFPFMRHVTLCWMGDHNRVRGAVEEELALVLKRCPAANGPASYWFLAVSLALFILSSLLVVRLTVSFLHSAW